MNLNTVSFRVKSNSWNSITPRDNPISQSAGTSRRESGVELRNRCETVPPSRVLKEKKRKGRKTNERTKPESDGDSIVSFRRVHLTRWNNFARVTMVSGGDEGKQQPLQTRVSQLKEKDERTKWKRKEKKKARQLWSFSQLKKRNFATWSATVLFCEIPKWILC